jgi:uncharacterized membrane protein
VLCYLAVSSIYWIISRSYYSHLLLDGSLTALLRAGSVSGIFTLAVWRLRAATPFAAICGGVICLLIISFTKGPAGSSIFHSGLTPLLLLFALTFSATKSGRTRKMNAGLAESKKGRSASQVFANLGVAALFATWWGMFLSGSILTVGKDDLTSPYSGHQGHVIFMHILWLPMLAALAEATADTVSSEIGQAFGGTPFMLTTLRRVPPGTDGAISLKGTLAGIAAAALIAATGSPALGMSPSDCAVAFAAGVAGLFFDSLLGATVERRGYLGNDLVNFTSTAFAAAIALLAIRLGQIHLLR